MDNIEVTSKLELWIPVYLAYKDYKTFSCPECGSGDVEVYSDKFDEKSGYVIFACTKCRKAMHFSYRFTKI